MTLFVYTPQNYPVSMDIWKTLELADTHNIGTVKQACFGAIFAYGQHILSNPRFDELPQKLAVEMLRDFATRRNNHMPGMPILPPKLGLYHEDEEDQRQQDHAASGRRGGKRRATS